MQENRSMNSPLVSIVIACYNDAENIEKAVFSALNQTYSNIEVIVVDDGSNIETKTVLNMLTPKINSLITQKNQGQSKARNNAIERASGEYILNLDSDDYFESEFCGKAVAKFEEDQDIKIVTCKARRFNKSGDIDVFTPLGGKLENFLFSNSALGSSMFKRCDWERVSGYEENLPILGFEDWEFYLNILKYGGYAFVIEEQLFNYQIRENSTTAQIKHLKQNKFKCIIFKHSDLYKDNFEEFVNFHFNQISKMEREKEKKLKTLDYRLGNIILTPVRILKGIFNRG